MAVLGTVPPADRHPAFTYLASLAPGSRRAMRAALDAVAGILSGGAHDAETFPWPALRYQHTAGVRTALSERYAPATANKTLSALRGVLRESWRLGLLDAEEYRRAVDLEPVRGSRLPRGRALDAGELAALFRACTQDPSPAGARDAALLGVLYGAGLRRSEAVALDAVDVHVEGGAVTVRSGKGRKDRLTYLPAGGIAAVNAWLELRGDVPGPLFVGVNKGGRLERRRLTDQAVRVVLQKRARQAGVAACAPHDLRRTFVSHLLDAGADLAAVQGLAGHSSPVTTMRYDRRGERAKQRAAGLLHVPFRPR
jgi:site-specific recombinase XerD